MRIHHDRLATRVAGSLLGVGFLLIGLYALAGAGEMVDAAARGRVVGFGVCAVIAGLVATPVSWLVKRLDNIWCAPPRRGWFRAMPSPGDGAKRGPDATGANHRGTEGTEKWDSERRNHEDSKDTNHTKFNRSI